MGTQAKPKKPTKLPSRTVRADDLVYEIDGEEYRPHEGESVTFRGRIKPDQLLKAVQLRSLDLNTDADAVAAQFAEIRQFVAGFIVAWDWTDDDGSPYLSPPTADTLADLDLEEIGWLLAKVVPERSIEQRGEGSTPST